jgi:hypothetical protein
VNELIIPDRTKSSTPNSLDPEKERIARYERRWKNRPPKTRTTSLVDEGEHPLDLLARYAESVGSVSEDFRTFLFAQLKGILPPHGVSEETMINAALAFTHGIRPMDELEGLFAVQLFSLHVVGLEMLRRSITAKDVFGNEVNALTGSSALQKHRGKGSQQRVTVEHVHVSDGGQAIVGTVGQQRGDTTTDEKR